jgi:hypothetical protein
MVWEVRDVNFNAEVGGVEEQGGATRLRLSAVLDHHQSPCQPRSGKHCNRKHAIILAECIQYLRKVAFMVTPVCGPLYYIC